MGGKLFIERELENVEYQLCDAQDLSQFSDRSFDLLFSSNMLEHIPDVDKCLQECRRVLKDDGVMLHTMPSRWWKVFNVGLAIIKRERYHVHGVSNSHRQEFVAFGVRSWKKRMESQGLHVTNIVGLPFYFGHGPTFLLLIKAGNALRFPASYLYVIQKG